MLLRDLADPLSSQRPILVLRQSCRDVVVRFGRFMVRPARGPVLVTVLARTTPHVVARFGNAQKSVSTLAPTVLRPACIRIKFVHFCARFVSAFESVILNRARVMDHDMLSGMRRRY